MINVAWLQGIETSLRGVGAPEMTRIRNRAYADQIERYEQQKYYNNSNNSNNNHNNDNKLIN